MISLARLGKTCAVGPSLAELIDVRLRRREVLGLFAAVLPGVATAGEPAPEWPEVTPVPSERLEVAPGHRVVSLLRWGDPVLDGAPPFAPRSQTAVAAAAQLGYNADFLAYFPLPRGSASPRRGLLAINHEYTDPTLMFPSCSPLRAQIGLTEAEVAVEMAAHGVSIVEVALDDTGWASRIGALNRRITALTPMCVRGPAAGHARLRTTDDPSGERVLGTIGNCAGGVTPWGTYLAAEENIQQYFMGPPLADGEEAAAHGRYRIGQDLNHAWGRWHARFDPRREPREANRFGWIVEIDPYDPTATPIKRTALGRCYHEGATVALSPGGRVAVYSADDAPFEYLYKFVSRDAWRPGEAAGALLDDGTLYVARFEPNGRLEWLPLVYGIGPLGPERGFRSQADVMIEARRAADLVGATPLDRPEGVAVHPRSGTVYVSLTKNAARTSDRVDAANPRAPNHRGHVLVLHTPLGDHGAREARWDVLFLGGDPAGDGNYSAIGRPTESGWLTNPDNLTIDPAGRLWIASDGQASVGRADGLHLLVPGRGLRRFLSAPLGAEVTGPAFTPDGSTLFVSIQHPGEGTTFDSPSTRWPDFQPGVPPRPSVVAIVRDDGGPVGG